MGDVPGGKMAGGWVPLMCLEGYPPLTRSCARQAPTPPPLFRKRGGIRPSPPPLQSTRGGRVPCIPPLKKVRGGPPTPLSRERQGTSPPFPCTGGRCASRGTPTGMYISDHPEKRGGRGPLLRTTGGYPLPLSKVREGVGYPDHPHSKK